VTVRLAGGSMKMKADTARGRGSFALQAVPVRFEFVAGAARGKQVRKACGSTTLFTDTHVINSAKNRPRSAGRSAVKISRVRTHRPGPTRQPHTHPPLLQSASQSSHTGLREKTHHLLQCRVTVKYWASASSLWSVCYHLFLAPQATAVGLRR
jgi:hypothetical protein